MENIICKCKLITFSINLQSAYKQMPWPNDPTDLELFAYKTKFLDLLFPLALKNDDPYFSIRKSSTS